MCCRRSFRPRDGGRRTIAAGGGCFLCRVASARGTLEAPLRGFFAHALLRGSVATTDAPAIRLDGLVKDYPTQDGGTFRAVRDLSLSIEEGAFYGLLGPNGAGKSTTIHILTGLARRTSGVAEVRGLDVSRDFRKVRRMMGLAAQEFAFDQFLAIEEVLMYAGMYFEMSRGQAKRRARELLERFELAHKRKERVQNLSGGQKRRLLIAKSLMHDPDILILDEPTAGIDVALRRDLWSYLREQNRAGKTILLTTHYIEEAEALCDQVGIIDQGRLVAEGTPAELVESGSGDRVIVGLKEPCREDPERLAAETGFQVAILDDGLSLVARGGRGGEMAGALMETLQRHAIRVDGLEIKRQSLEEAFVRATGAEIAPDGTIVRRDAAQDRGVNV